MKIVALLNGRGNNTLKDKNIREVCGKPLLTYPAKAVMQSSQIHDFYVSSDNEKILSTAHELGYKKIKRPADLGLPDSNQEDAIRHALKRMHEEGVQPDILVIVLAKLDSSPSFSAIDKLNFFKFLFSPNFNGFLPLFISNA